MRTLDSPEKEAEDRRTATAEHRAPPAAAVVVAGLVYALLPSQLLVIPRFVVPSIEIALLIALIATNPRRLTRETRWSRAASIVLALVVILANLGALVMLITVLGRKSSGSSLLIAAMQIWLTNVIGYGLLYWEIDRGGPVARHRMPRSELQAADWRFSQDEDADAVTEVARSASAVAGWIPNLVDYFYLSLTNSSAFSPTDSMPISSRAKLLMGGQATTALFITLIVIARAVSAIGG